MTVDDLIRETRRKYGQQETALERERREILRSLADRGFLQRTISPVTPSIGIPYDPSIYSGVMGVEPVEEALADIRRQYREQLRFYEEQATREQQMARKKQERLNMLASAGRIQSLAEGQLLGEMGRGHQPQYAGQSVANFLGQYPAYFGTGGPLAAWAETARKKELGLPTYYNYLSRR